MPTTSRGYDAGKKVNGRNRFIVTDTLGLLLTVVVVTVVVVTAAVQDRDGAKPALPQAYIRVSCATICCMRRIRK